MLVEIKSGDVLVCLNERQDLFSKIKRWAMGRYEHVETYIGNSLYGVPALVESDNRGVVIQNVAHQDGRHVMVMRPKSTVSRRSLAMEAIKIASDSKANYDWTGGLRFAVFRVLREKLGIKRPLRRYVRDKKMICSEAVAEIFWKNDVNIVPMTVVPIPADFAEESDLLKFVAVGRLRVVTVDDSTLALYLETDD